MWSDQKQHSDVSCVKAQYWPTGKQQQNSLLVLTANDRNHQDAIAVYVPSVERFKTFHHSANPRANIINNITPERNDSNIRSDSENERLRVRPKLRPLPVQFPRPNLQVCTIKVFLPTPTRDISYLLCHLSGDSFFLDVTHLRHRCETLLGLDTRVCQRLAETRLYFLFYHYLFTWLLDKTSGRWLLTFWKKIQVH